MSAKKGGSKSAGGSKSGGEAERDSILQQMKVRTTIKKDKSWIHEQQSSEYQKDENIEKNTSMGSYSSPHDRPKSNREPFWNTEDPDRLASSPPMPLKNSRNSPDKFENDKAASLPSAPNNSGRSSSSTGYIIRGMYTKPIDSSTKGPQPVPANGYHKSYKDQAKSASLPRVPTATGYRMTTEDYKKLAPFNTRTRLSDDIDEDDPFFSPEEHSKRSEAANSILKSTASKQRSYVLSAAKKSNGSPTQDIAAPFLAKRVEVQDEHGEGKKAHTLPPKMTPQFNTGAYSHNEKTQIPNKSTTVETRTTFTSKESNEYAKDPEWKSKPNSYSSSDKSHNEKTQIPDKSTTVETRTTFTSKERNENAKDPEWKSKPNSYSSSDKSHVEKIQIPDKSTTVETRTTFTSKESNEYAKDPQWKSMLNSYSSSDKSMETTRRPLEPLIQNEAKPKVISSSEKSDATSRTPINSSTVTRTVTTVTKNESHDEIPQVLDKSTTRETRTRNTFTNEASDATSRTPTSSSSTVTRTATTITKNESAESDKRSPEPLPRSDRKPKARNLPEDREKPMSEDVELISWNEPVPSKPNISTGKSEKKETPKAEPRTEIKDRVSSKDSKITQPESRSMEPPLIVISPELNWRSSNQGDGEKGKVSSNASSSDSRSSSLLSGKGSATTARYIVPECLEDDTEDFTVSTRRTVSDLEDRTTTTTTTRRETRSENPRVSMHNEPNQITAKPITHFRENNVTNTTRASYTVPNYLSDQESESDQRSRFSSNSRESTFTESKYKDPTYLINLDADPESRSISHSGGSTIITTTTNTSEPRNISSEYLNDKESASTRFTSSSRERITTTTTTKETHYESPSATNYNRSDPNANSRGVLFVKEYVNTSELPSRNASSPVYDRSGGGYFSDNVERESYSSSFSSLYSSAPSRSGEGPCTYCGREIKDCAKIILEHLNIYCHEYCFKCAICHKPMGDLLDSIFIHRNVVHCQSCYEKLF